VLQFERASITTIGVLLRGALFASGAVRWVLIGFGVLLIVAAVISFAEPEDAFAGVGDILGSLHGDRRVLDRSGPCGA
jgi:hypothetical protein